MISLKAFLASSMVVTLFLNPILTTPNSPPVRVHPSTNGTFGRISHSSIVVQMPGWSGLTNARVTIFGDIYQLPVEMEPVAKEVTSTSSCYSSEMSVAVLKANIKRNKHLDWKHVVLQNA